MLNIIFVDDLPVATERAQAAFRAICDRYGINLCDNRQRHRRGLPVVGRAAEFFCGSFFTHNNPL